MGTLVGFFIKEKKYTISSLVYGLSYCNTLITFVQE